MAKVLRSISCKRGKRNPRFPRHPTFPPTWTLPKGTPSPGETTEQTALREVTEETGLRVRIIEPVDSIAYTFVQRGSRVDKTVFYFLMEPIGGDLADHDREFDDVRWFDLADAGRCPNISGYG